MNVPRDLRYTKTHEWVRMTEGVAVVGITDFAQEQLSDLTFVELPAVDDEVQPGDEVAVVESVKAASDVYAPVSGVIVEINDTLVNSPETINSDCYGAGWIFKIKPDNKGDIDELLDPDSYTELLPESAED